MKILDHIIENKKKSLVIFVAIFMVLGMSMVLMPHATSNSNLKVASPAVGETATFSEVGLASGTAWAITVDGSTFTGTAGNTITARVGTSGTYTTTWSATGYIGGSESVTYPDSSTISVLFTPVTYNVTISESGLASGTSWTLTFDSTAYTLTNSSYTFHEPNGNYTFSWTASGYYSGSSYVLVAGVNTSAYIIFSEFTQIFHTTVSESGLPTSAPWTLVFNGNTYDLTNTSYTFNNLVNGTYSYSATTSNPYYYYPASGSTTINGANTSVSLVFTAITWNVTFSEDSLGAGTTWTLVFNGNSYTLTNTSYTFHDLTNGTYAYSSSVNGNAGSSGNAVISGSDVAITIVFPHYYTVVFVPGGLPSNVPWTLVFNGTTYTSTGGSITLHVVAGTYSYTWSATGYRGGSGTITVG